MIGDFRSGDDKFISGCFSVVDDDVEFFVHFLPEFLEVVLGGETLEVVLGGETFEVVLGGESLFEFFFEIIQIFFGGKVFFELFFEFYDVLLCKHDSYS